MSGFSDLRFAQRQTNGMKMQWRGNTSSRTQTHATAADGLHHRYVEVPVGSGESRGQWNVIINIKSYHCHALRQ